MPYAEEIINTIRNNSPKAIVIVGTENYCLDILPSVYLKLPYENILYSFHFYAGEHGKQFMDSIDEALKRDLSIIVSEWGTTKAIPEKNWYKDESEKWINFLDERNISWINWSFSNKDEATSILKPNTDLLIDENLTEEGSFIKELFLRGE